MKDGIYILLGKGFFQPMSNQESLEGPKRWSDDDSRLSGDQRKVS